MQCMNATTRSMDKFSSGMPSENHTQSELYDPEDAGYWDPDEQGAPPKHGRDKEMQTECDSDRLLRDLSSCKDELDAANQKLSDRDREIADTVRDKQQLDEGLKRANTRVCEQDTKLASLQDEKDHLHKKNQNLQTMLDQAHENIQAEQVKLKAKNAHDKQKEKKLHEAQLSLKVERTAKEEATAKIIALEDQVEELTSLVVPIATERDDLRGKIKLDQRGVWDKNEELVSLRLHALELETQVAACDEAHAETRKKLKSAHTQLTASRTALESKQTELRVLRVARDNLQESIAGIKKKLTQQDSGTEGRCREADSELAETKKELSRKNLQLEELRCKGDSMIEKLRHDMSQKELEIQVLRRETDTSLAEMRLQLSQKDDQLQQLSRETDAALAVVKQQLSQKSSEIQDLRREADAALAVVTQQLSQKSNEIQDLRRAKENFSAHVHDDVVHVGDHARAVSVTQTLDAAVPLTQNQDASCAVSVTQNPVLSSVEEAAGPHQNHIEQLTKVLQDAKASSLAYYDQVQDLKYDLKMLSRRHEGLCGSIEQANGAISSRDDEIKRLKERVTVVNRHLERTEEDAKNYRMTCSKSAAIIIDLQDKLDKCTAAEGTYSTKRARESWCREPRFRTDDYARNERDFARNERDFARNQRDFARNKRSDRQEEGDYRSLRNQVKMLEEKYNVINRVKESCDAKCTLLEEENRKQMSKIESTQKEATSFKVKVQDLESKQREYVVRLKAQESQIGTLTQQVQMSGATQQEYLKAVESRQAECHAARVLESSRVTTSRVPRAIPRMRGYHIPARQCECGDPTFEYALR
jgi:chromosome segregation ATPase